MTNSLSKNKIYGEYKGFDLPAFEKEVSEYWAKNNIFEKSISNRNGAKPYVFFEGPPSANGMPGIHHVMARTIKDIFCRYKTLQGFQVHRKAGWDTHGLPVELGVEKELGITKEDIGKKITVEEYNEACKKAVMRYTDIWNNLTKQMGYWVDMEHPYITYEPKYMESVWWLLKQIYDKGLIYKGYTIQPYSPKAGTGLSSHELNQPGTYQDVTDTTIVAQFKYEKREGINPPWKETSGDVFFLAWTTTPWTLPSNTALTVGENIDYVLVKTFNQYTKLPIKVVLAKTLVASQFSGGFEKVENEVDFESTSVNNKKIPYLILDEFKGKDLVGLRYEQLLKYAQPYQKAENAFRVISGDFVTTADGTGIVHTAPTFGADDAKAAKNAKPEVPPMLVLDDNGNPIPLVDLQGKFTKHVGEHAGKYVKNEYYNEGEVPEKSVDVEIAIHLKEENRAFKVEKYKHSYPNCWRTDKPILYYPLDSWFIKVTDVRDRMYDLNQTINWKPKATGEGRFGNWLINANDWNLSRSRYWGIPLPIWRTEDGSEEIIIGSVEELVGQINKSIELGNMTSNPFAHFEVGNMSEANYQKIDLHKNVVDKIVLTSSTGKPMHRESDLIDVWFDSGSMPYAQWHYPFENKEKIDQNTAFPADYIAEGVDQTRGWFYTLHAIGTMVFDSVAYKNVVSNGLVLDKNGNKMSKRLGNTVDPFKTMDSFGADIVRWYMLTNASPWDNLKFDEAGLDETKRKFFGTLYNVYSFFALYANIDGFKANEKIESTDWQEIDRWIISKLNSLIAEVQDAMDDYEPTKATRAIEEFVTDHLSNWYIRLCRKRFWKNDNPKDKEAAYQVLYTCLHDISVLMASFSPFYADKLYVDLTGGKEKESVHLADFPVFTTALINKDLEQKMLLAQRLTSMVLAIRKKEMVKVRQPLQKLLIPIQNDEIKNQILSVTEIIKQEVNIKEIEFLTADSSIQIVQEAKPNFKQLGPKAGANMKFIAEACKALSQEDIAALQGNGSIELHLSNGSTFELALEDVQIASTDMPGWQVVSENGLTVALDMTITEQLELEGLARELVNKIQNLRKIKDLQVTDKIVVELQSMPKINMAIDEFNDYIRGEILAASIEVFDVVQSEDEVEINEFKLRVNIHKA
ncbi:MAG: isoleucine--tRNA ligase [Flavobacteriales bacterium]|nr:isoleucine--tRNA ligase [Flavobacteriales bacterium]